MRKILFALVFSLFLLAVPAFAQNHGGGGSHGNGGQHGGGQTHGGPVRGGGGEQHGGPVRGGGEQHGGGQVRGAEHDRFGHDFHREDFGREHFTRFGIHDGRFFNGRREFFYGGFWFYGNWPGWFYNCNTYFDYGPDGLWYAYCYDNPGLFFRVDID